MDRRAGPRLARGLAGIFADALRGHGAA
jgi:hypothetical protein